MRRGEIWWADLDPALAGEASKVRPVVIVSNDASNAAVLRGARGVITMVPLTSNVDRVYPFQVRVPANPITGLARESKAQAEQVRALGLDRYQGRIGSLPAGLLADVDAALRLHLNL